MSRLCRLMLLLAVAAMALLWQAAARAAADKPSADFTEERYFRFGMDVSAANKVVADSKHWEIAYRIDTPSTNEINCRLDKQVIYLLRFYQGRCYHLEKRADIAAEQVQPVFEFFHKVYGDSPEATQSKGGELYFARWELRGREIELTAYQRQSGSYAVIYQELDKQTEGEALYARDSEIATQPMEVDPITGQPRPLRQEEGSDQQAGGDNGDQQSGADQNQDAEQDKSDGDQEQSGGKQDGDTKDGAQKDGDSKDGAKKDGDNKDGDKTPPKHDDDDDDWMK